MTSVLRLSTLLMVVSTPVTALATNQEEAGAAKPDSVASAGGGSAKVAASSVTKVRLPLAAMSWIMGWPSARELNGKLDREHNNRLGASRGIMFWIDGQIAAPDILRLKLTLPTLGVECTQSGSTTTHATSGQPVTVNWQLFICGLSVSPRVAGEAAGIRLVSHPLGVGIFAIGMPFSSGLSVTDRAGRLDASAVAVGTTSRVGLEVGNGPVRWSLELGYRMLRFSRVALTPRDGFRDRPDGALMTEFVMPEAVDMSGPLLVFSTTVRLGGS